MFPKDSSISTGVQNVITNVMMHIDARAGRHVHQMSIKKQKQQKAYKPPFQIAIATFDIKQLFVILYDLTMRVRLRKGFTYYRPTGLRRELEVPPCQAFFQMQQKYKTVSMEKQTKEVSDLLMTLLVNKFHSIFEEVAVQIQLKDNEDNSEKNIHFMVFLLIILDHCAELMLSKAQYTRIDVQAIPEMETHLGAEKFVLYCSYMQRLSSLKLDLVGLGDLRVVMSGTAPFRELFVNQWVPPLAARALRTCIVQTCQTFGHAKNYGKILELKPRDYSEEVLSAKPPGGLGKRNREDYEEGLPPLKK